MFSAKNNVLLINEITNQLINWHQKKHPNINNMPNEKSQNALYDLCQEILIPIQNTFGKVHITYGFTSHKLLSQIKKLNPCHIAPSLDQHASFEVNTNNKIICNRNGAACDFVVTGYEDKIYEIANWVSKNLPFDRMYLYGNDRPIHVSFGPQHSRFIQVMKTSKNGKRIPGKRGTNKEFTSIIGGN